MNKKTGWILAVVAATLLLLLYFEPTGVVRGTIAGERFFAGRPVHVWESRLAGDPGMRSEAVTALQSGGPDSVPVLTKLLEDHSAAPEVRLAALEILKELGGEASAAGPAVATATTDADPHVQALAASALPELEVPAEAALPVLLPLLESEHSIVASRAISKYREEAVQALPQLVKVLRDEDMDTESRWNAARTLGKLGPNGIEALPVLIEFTTHPENTIREHAAEAIGDIGPTAEAGIPALRECLDDPATRVRRDAVRSLEYIGPAARVAVDDIVPLLVDPEEIVRTAARNTLKAIAPEALPPEPMKEEEVETEKSSDGSEK